MIWLFLSPCQEPHERARLYFLLAWLHAILQERLRYSPLGWSKKYEFNESDLRMACDTLDTWLESVAQVCTKSVATVSHTCAANCKIFVSIWNLMEYSLRMSVYNFSMVIYLE